MLPVLARHAKHQWAMPHLDTCAQACQGAFGGGFLLPVLLCAQLVGVDGVQQAAGLHFLFYQLLPLSRLSALSRRNCQGCGKA